MNHNTSILIRNGMVALPEQRLGTTNATREQVVTLMTNVMSYGYGFSLDVFNALLQESVEGLTALWEEIEPVLKNITGADRNMGDWVVYKNFPEEVLNMSQSEYWANQIAMYCGWPNELFTQDEKEREPMREGVRLNVLRLAGQNSLEGMYRSLCHLPARWTDEQRKDIEHLAPQFADSVSLSEVGFKENMVLLAMHLLVSGKDATVSTATDVMRFATGLSGGDISGKEKSKFVNFKRPERRFMLNMLEGCKHLEADMQRDVNRWKKLMRALRPGDYSSKYPRVVKAYDKLYNGKLPPSFNSVVESKLKAKDVSVLADLRTRPGEFVRRLHVCVLTFGDAAVDMFCGVLPKLTTIQLLKVQSYLGNINERKNRLFPPKGNWNKVKIVPNEKSRQINEKHIQRMLNDIADELANRLSDMPGVVLDKRTSMIKLQTNDSELTPYGRGTAFPIPKNVKYIRTSSYWKAKGRGNIWYDNGINFFDKNWKSMGTTCWNSSYDGALFSGDPTSSKTAEGDACQVIDIYPEKLRKQGVRYAVWNILCYSNQTFDEAEQVFAALQWGTDANAGKIFEPARNQLAFPVTGKQLTKYIAYVDLKENKLVYMDANLTGVVSSASRNAGQLQESMPAFVEYLNSLPSVHDLFKHAPEGDELHIAYDDADIELSGEPAYVFRPSNEENAFEQLDINNYLG